MALNIAAAAIGFLLAASAVSMVTVGTISLVKTIKAEKEWKEIDTGLASVKNSNGMSSLADKFDKNNEKNKKDQKDQEEKIELLNTEAQLKKDIETLQAQIEQAKKDLGTATAAKNKLQKAKNTFHEMEIDLNAMVALRDDSDVQPRLDSNIWSPILGPGGAAIAPRFNVGGPGEWANNKNAVLELAAAVNGRRTGALYNAGAFTLASLAEILCDRQGGRVGALAAAGGAHPVAVHTMALANQFLHTAWDEDFDKKVDEIAGYNKTIEENTAQIKEKQAQLEALKKNK